MAYENWDKWKTRPARRQVDDQTLQQHLAHLTSKKDDPKNVWSGRVMRTGPREEHPPGGRRPKERSRFRCVPELDVGRTRGSDSGQQHTFCWYFAKGCCSQGADCTYLHRVPTAADEAHCVKDMGSDIFGREKRAEHEGYRKGAGTFERDNRTIYCNYEGAGSYDLPRVRQLIEANFAVWGPIKSIYVKHNLTIAFIKYEWRSSAEFAKEAMHKQGLTGSTQAEVLTLRWSNEDPNPVSIVTKKREHRDAFEQAAMASWEALPEEQQRARIQQLQLVAALKRREVVSSYPDTDAQFGATAATEDDVTYPDTDHQYTAGSGAQDLGMQMRGAWQAAAATVADWADEAQRGTYRQPETRPGAVELQGPELTGTASTVVATDVVAPTGYGYLPSNSSHCVSIVSEAQPVQTEAEQAQWTAEQLEQWQAWQDYYAAHGSQQQAHEQQHATHCSSDAPGLGGLLAGYGSGSESE